MNALTAASGGIPLYAVTALETWAAGTASPELTVELQAIVRRRMHELHDDEAGILARAAVLGKVVDVTTAAKVCKTSPAHVIAAAAAAGPGILARSGQRGQIHFSHDLVRDAVLDWLTPDETAAIHSAAAAFYETDDVVRAARHAVHAAHRSVAEATRAVALGRRAAEVLAHGGAPDDATALLDLTIAANDFAGRPASHARLLLERAATVLLGGHLSAAHDFYDEATAAAISEEDPNAVAEGAVGLGSLWVNTVRSRLEQRRILQIQRSALTALPPAPTALRLRLRARIDGEAMFWEGAAPDALISLLDVARRFGDATTLLDVFSVAHNPLLSPEYTKLRIQLSEEMLMHAAGDRGGILSLMALCWRTVDLFLAGDDRAERALAELTDAAEAAQCLSILHVVRLIETMLMICHGRLGQAEQAAQAAFDLGTRAQDADALSYFGGHLVAIRWFQQRDGEMLELMQSIASSAQVDVVDHAFEAATAAVAARSGHLDVARRYLRRVVGPGLRSLPRFSTWLVTLVTVIEAAVALNDHHTAMEAYDLLKPYAELPVAPSLAVVNFGCVHYWLGTAARTAGKAELAEQHLRAAVETNIRQGHVPATAVARAELARVLVSRPAEAKQLLVTAREAASASEMDALAGYCDAELLRLDHARHLQVVQDEKDNWFVTFSGRRVPIRDLAGIRMLATLTAVPGREISAAELAYGRPSAPQAAAPPLLDSTARRALEGKVRELAATVARSREQGDLAAQVAAEDEMDAIAAHLSAASGIAGRSRSFTDENERARTSVRKAIVRALQEIDQQDPAAAAHLRRHLVTGATCKYTPHSAG